MIQPLQQRHIYNVIYLLQRPLIAQVLKKDYIILKKQVEHTKTERSVLGYVHHPFIVGLTMAFQVREKKRVRVRVRVRARVR